MLNLCSRTFSHIVRVSPSNHRTIVKFVFLLCLLIFSLFSLFCKWKLGGLFMVKLTRIDEVVS